MNASGATQTCTAGNKREGRGGNGWWMGLLHYRDIYDAGVVVPGPG